MTLGVSALVLCIALGARLRGAYNSARLLLRALVRCITFGGWLKTARLTARLLQALYLCKLGASLRT